ncbi:hypothetical protein BN1356_01366 [Streptococcus varani]|uniref:Uncharacterized protein n=1 Tax=Streptococcus varani TaxID=1608583 RepID=A0A0E4H4K7_9STRE|nr:hypothetical protein [Streptococcus varani]CQR25023.1 hypothetical protein BN1356_01366 [Streptococcus varani]
MTTQDNNYSSKFTPLRYKNEKPYNDVPCENNQVLAPMVIRDETMRQNNDINPSNLKTFKFYGKSVLVGFVPVPVENFENTLRIFNMHVNEYLNRYSKGRFNTLSLDEMLEKMNSAEEVSYDPNGIPSHEEKLMLLETLEELIEVVFQRNEKYGKILKLIYQDVNITKQEIIAKLGMKKTQGYVNIHKAQAMAKDVYKELNQ